MTADSPAAPEEEVTLFRTSFAQQRMWFLHQLDPGDHHYNVPILLQFDQAVRPDALQLAFAELVSRHEILRTTFVEVDGELLQAVSRTGESTAPVVAIETSPTDSVPPVQRPEVLAAVLDLVRAPFDLRVGPLLRARLFDLRDGSYLFVLTMHHIIVDGWSIGVLCEELRALYQAALASVPSALPPLELQIGDIAEEERERAAGPEQARHRAYWRTQLAGDLAAPALPFDHDRPSHSTTLGSTLDFVLSSEEAAAIAAFGRDREATVFMTLLAAFYVLLYRYSGSCDQIVGAPMANREDSRTAGLIGLFVNTIPLRATIDPDAGFAALLDNVRETTLGAYEHQELSLEQIIDEVAPERAPGRNPLVAVLFAMQSPPPAELDFADARASFVGVPNEVTRADLELHFWPRGDWIAAQFVYSAELFDAATIEHMRDAYTALLRAAIESPQTPIHRLPVGTERALVAKDLVPLLGYDPSAVAIADADAQITHGELRAAAASLASAMAEARGEVVALALERGPDLVAALVAAVSAGARRVVWFPPSLPRPYRERSLRELAPSLVVDAASVAAARAAGPAEPLSATATIGLLDSSLAAILVALLQSGQAQLDRPDPVPQTVLTADRRCAPPGVLGELCVGRPDLGVLRTGVPARLRRDFSVAAASASRGLAWDGCRWADLGTVEAVLLGNILIDECAVLARRASSGADELVAYVATTAPISAGWLSEFARTALPPPLVPRAFVCVAALPTTKTGALDIAALRRMPVIDDELIAQWAAQLPEGAQVQAAPDVPVVPRIRVGGAEPPPAPTEHVAAHGAGEPAVLDGGPAVEPTVASLPDALVRAAHEVATTELVFLDGSGAERRISYAALLDAARRVLGGLRAAGLVPGDLAMVHLTRNDDFVAAIWGCFLGGIVPAPVAPNPVGGSDRAAAAWEALGRPLIIGEPAHPSARRARIEDLLAHAPDCARHEPDPDELALLLLTSGSTGAPKGVRLTHRNILARSAATAQMNGFGPDDVSFNWMPLEHVGGIVMSHLHDVYVCCQQVHAATSWVLADPLRWLTVVDRYRATNTWAPNFAFGLIADRLAEVPEPGRFDVTSLRFILNGGEAIVPRTARRFLRALEPFGLPRTAMRPAWGMSETSSGVIYSETFSLATTAESDEFTELGKPVPGARLRIVDTDGAVVPAGAIGRVQVGGPTVTRGYYGDLERDREAFTEDGWFDTGDLGRIQHGALTLTGRAKDTIIVHGANFTCHAIESAVEESPFVLRSYSAAVAVRPPGSDTDALAIICSLQPGAAEDEALADIRARVLTVGLNPDFLIPVPPERIPKTDIGKIQRSLLRERFAAGEFADAVRRAQVAGAPANTVPNWFFRPVWLRRDRLRREAPVAGGVLFTGEPGDLGELLADRLGEQGVPVARADAQDIAAASGPSAGGTPLRAVLCFLAERDGPEKLDSSRAALSPDVFEVTRILRSLSASPEPPELYVVGCGAQAVTDTDEVHSDLAMIPALLRSAAAEAPGLRVRFIDLDPKDPAARADHVIGELGEAANDVEVAYRAGVRWVKGIERLPAEPAEPAEIAPGALHLISGGFGGLADELARLLIARFHGRVLLIGRHDPGPRQLAAHQHPGEAAGRETARYSVADICDIDQVWDAVTNAERDWGVQLSGIWHLAGSYREQSLAAATEAELADVSAAKAAGVRALHRIALRRPGVRFVSFSSVNGFFGGAAVGGYSAANAYLDAFARYQRRDCGVDAQSIAWTMWDRIGMSAHVEHPEITRARGYHILSRSEALDSLLIALAHDEPHVLVGLDETKPAIRARLGGSPPTGQTLVTSLPKAAPSPAGPLVRDRYGCVVPTRVESGSLARGWVEAQGDTERRLSAIWQQVLGSSSFGATDSFFEIGGSSVLLAQAHRLIQEEFERSIALVDLFRYPTVSSLAAYLSGTEAEPDPDGPHSGTGVGADRARIRKETRRRTRQNRA